MENILENNEINYDGLLPEVLKEEKVGYKGLLAGGIFSVTLAAINPLAFIPGAAFVASYLYKNKFSKTTKSKQYFNGARDIYLNSIDNKVALSIALFYANKAIEYDITNFKAVAMKAFILKAMGNINEMEIVLNTIPNDMSEFNEVRNILKALQLKEPNKIKDIPHDVYLTEEEIAKILKEKGFNISKEFLDSIHKSVEHIEKEKEYEKNKNEEMASNFNNTEDNVSIDSLSEGNKENAFKEKSVIYTNKEKSSTDISIADIENNIEETALSKDEISNKEIGSETQNGYIEEDKVVNLVEEKEVIVFNYIKSLFHENKISCSLSMNKTSKYCDIMGENRFIRFKFNGKKEYAITPFTVKELKDTKITLQVEVTPKSETGVSRVIFNSLDDLEFMNDIIIKCYNKSLTES